MSTVSVERFRERIAEALAEFGVDREQLRADATLEELDIDSLDLFELSEVLKREFGIEVDPEDFEGVTTFGDAERVLLAHVR